MVPQERWWWSRWEWEEYVEVRVAVTRRARRVDVSGIVCILERELWSCSLETWTE